MSRTSVITDWRTRDEDPPDVAPGETFEHVIAPQTFVVLRRILVHDLVLVRLRVGAAEVPFEQVIVDGRVRTYRPEIGDAAVKARLAATGATFADRDAITIIPGLEVRATLRNDHEVPAKPRAALVVEESPRE